MSEGWPGVIGLGGVSEGWAGVRGLGWCHRAGRGVRGLGGRFPAAQVAAGQVAVEQPAEGSSHTRVAGGGEGGEGGEGVHVAAGQGKGWVTGSLRAALSLLQTRGGDGTLRLVRLQPPAPWRPAAGGPGEGDGASASASTATLARRMRELVAEASLRSLRLHHALCGQTVGLVRAQVALGIRPTHSQPTANPRPASTSQPLRVGSLRSWPSPLR